MTLPFVDQMEVTRTVDGQAVIIQMAFRGNIVGGFVITHTHWVELTKTVAPDLEEKFLSLKKASVQ